MATSVLIPIRCEKCGRLYHVPPSSLEQRAKCRPCGNEFLLPRIQQDPPRGKRKVAAHLNAPQNQQVASQIAALTAVRKSNPEQTRRAYAIGAAIAATSLALLVFMGVWNYRHAADAANFQRGHFVRLSAPHDAMRFRSVVELVEAIEPSVVQIESADRMGSGFVLDESGLVVTCHHCIENAGECNVTFVDGRRERIIGLRGGWPDHDIAIVQISTLKPMVPLPLETRTSKKGEPVVAFGAPEGLSFSISEGSVSALRTGADLVDILRRPPYNITRGTDVFHLAPKTSVVQITAATMPGSSGGPVVNFSGNVVGICSFMLRRDGQHFGFCISVDDIRRVADSLDGQVLTALE